MLPTILFRAAGDVQVTAKDTAQQLCGQVQRTCEAWSVWAVALRWVNLAAVICDGHKPGVVLLTVHAADCAHSHWWCCRLAVCAATQTLADQSAQSCLRRTGVTVGSTALCRAPQTGMPLACSGCVTVGRMGLHMYSARQVWSPLPAADMLGQPLDAYACCYPGPWTL